MPAAASPHPFVRFDHVRKSYDGGELVVRDLNLDIARGEFVTLLGPSGSGKTTTLMMLAGFERPDAGDIFLDGRTVAHTPPHRRDIGVVFQSFALFPHMTVAENVAFPLQVRRVGGAERRERVARALAMVRLEGLGGRMPAQLSGGQQQRVALARALVFGPHLVLMDEPLGALDRQLREQLQLEIRHLHRSLGVTMVYVTHDQSEALTMSDRIAVFAGGVVRQVGTPRALYDEPGDAFVARFVGENNCLTGILEGVEDGIASMRLACGVRVEGVMVEEMPVGAPCVMSVRPERIVAAGEADGLPAILIDTIFQGDHARLRFALGTHDGAPEITVKRSAEAGLGGLLPGQPAALTWQPRHGRIFHPETPMP